MGRMSVLIDDLPEKINSRLQRLVWLVGRPCQGLTGRIAPATFPFFHWAVLITPLGGTPQTVCALLRRLQSEYTSGVIDSVPMGIIQELRYIEDTGKTVYKGHEITNLEFEKEFAPFSIAYAGLTIQFADPFRFKAQRIWITRSWEYHVLKSNCQHFATDLLVTLTGHEPLPRTIARIIKDHISTSLGQPQPLKPSRLSTASVSLRYIQRRMGLSASTTSRAPAPPSSIELSPIGLDSLRLKGFHAELQAADKCYLASLNLGNPQCLHNFEITEDRQPTYVTQAVVVLYPSVLLLFRYHAGASLKYWEGGSKGPLVPFDQGLYMYCYLYPRHIKNITETRNGFRLECDGLWLAKEGPPSELFTLEFQPSNAVPGDGTSAAWQHSLELFQRRGNITEIGTIFDRLPLEKKYVSEINVINAGSYPDVYRTVLRMPLTLISAEGIKAVVARRLESSGCTNQRWKLQYKNREGLLQDVSDNFPMGTDGGWREFFVAVFYVTFLDG